MPLPVGHSLAGAAIYTALDEDGTLRARRRLLAVVMLANAPDLDLVPGILIGDPNRFHQGLTHTLLAAVLAGALAAWAASLLGRGWPIRRGPSSAGGGMFVMVTVAWASHVVLDVFAHDSRPPLGVPILSPFLDQRLMLGPLFLPVQRIVGPASAGEFLLSLLSWHNLVAVIFEALLLVPLVAAARWTRRIGTRTARPA